MWTWFYPAKSQFYVRVSMPLLAMSVFHFSSKGPLHMSLVIGGTNFVFCSYGKFNSGYQDEKCPKGPLNTRGTAFRLVSDLISHAQLKMFCHGQSRYWGWSVHMGKISSSVTEISVTGPARLLIWIWTHWNFCKEKCWNLFMWGLQFTQRTSWLISVVSLQSVCW